LRNQKALFYLFLANSISGCAQGISMIAIPWYFNAVLGKGSSYGVFYSIVTVGSFFWSFYNGSIIDKHNRKKIFYGINIIGAAVLLSAALCCHLLPAYIWLSAGLVFLCTQFIYNIHYPNLYAFAQEISPPAAYTKITSYIEIQGQATTVIGGALAGLLMEGTHEGIMNICGFQLYLGVDISAWSLSKIFLLDGSTYLAGLLLISLIRYVPIAERKPDEASLLERLKFGIQYLSKFRVILLFGWASLAVFITIIVNTYYTMPNYIKLFLHERSGVYAGSELWFAFGAMCAGIFARYIFTSWHEGKKIIGLSILAVTVYVVFMFNKNMAIFYAANMLLGLCNASIRIFRISYIFRIVPNHVIGRVNGILNMASYIFRALLTLLFSLAYFDNELGMILMMGILAAFCLLGAVIIISYYQRLLLAERLRAEN